MVFCEKCGISLNAGANFCPACGAVAATGASAQTGQQDAQNNKAMAAIVYVPFLFIIPLLTGEHKESRFLKFHTNQGAALTIAFVATWILLTFISLVIPIVGMMVTSLILFPVAGIASFVLCIYGIVNALNGMLKPLPLIGGLVVIR